jgi:hypothetical protein
MRQVAEETGAAAGRALNAASEPLAAETATRGATSRPALYGPGP